MATTRNRPLSPNILDLREPVEFLDYLDLKYNRANPIPGITDAWRQRTVDRYQHIRNTRGSWELANEQANRRKFMETQLDPLGPAKKKQYIKDTLENFFGDPMKSGKKAEDFRKRMSDIVVNFGKEIDNGW